jgi:DNA-binding NarL/FixJ family response regulator
MESEAECRGVADPVGGRRSTDTDGSRIHPGRCSVEVVGSCSNIKSALAKVASSDIEVAILDIRLGRESIAPVARELEKKGIPFVFYSGQVGSDPIRDEFPTIKILPKPAAARVIVAEIAALMHFGERPRSF